MLERQCEVALEDDVCLSERLEACRRLAQPVQKWRHEDDIAGKARLREYRPYRLWPQRRFRDVAVGGCV